MHNTFFNHCTESTKRVFDETAGFGESNIFNSEPGFDIGHNNDLSLKLRDNIFAKEFNDVVDSKEFYLGLHDLDKDSAFREYNHDLFFSALPSTPSSDEKKQNGYYACERTPTKNIFCDSGADFTSTNKMVQNKSISETGGDSSECHSVAPKSEDSGVAQNPHVKSYSTDESDCSKSKGGDIEKEIDNLVVYKTPNYKQKKRPSSKIMNKHSASDIKQHEEIMKEKYGVKLSTRKDVVSKTLLRSLKRYYTDLFLQSYSLAKKESPESYMYKIREFSQTILYDKLVDMKEWGVSLEAATKFISILVSPGHIKATLVEESDIALHKDFYSCLYQYTHKKLANMLRTLVCGFLFHEFVNDGHLATFISQCPTMSQNYDCYSKMGASFVETILKHRFEEPDFY